MKAVEKQTVHLDFINVISVVIRVRNAVAELERCLTKLNKQVVPDGTKLELVVVDNESSDDSAFVACKYGAQVVPIMQDEFSWGRALNRGIAKTTGQIILLLSADACPVDCQWIKEMISPFSNSSVAAVYGRQIPFPDAPIDERVRIEKKFGPDPECYDTVKKEFSLSGKGMMVSNACAAIRRDVWEIMPYDENIKAGEEGPWSYNILWRGYSIVYQPLAKVYHSHRDGAFKLAWREWEIVEKNMALKGSRLDAAFKLRWLGAFFKRRFLNCMWSNVPLRVRLAGLVRLPLEMLAFVVVALCPNDSMLRQRYRWLFWK